MEERRTSDIIVSINEELVKLHKEIIDLKHDNELLSTDSDNKIRALMKDMLSVLDAFDRVRTVIVEKELDKGEDAKKVIQRFQNTEKVLRNKLEQNGVREIAMEVGTMVNDNLLQRRMEQSFPWRRKDSTITSPFFAQLRLSLLRIKTAYEGRGI